MLENLSTLEKILIALCVVAIIIIVYIWNQRTKLSDSVDKLKNALDSLAAINGIKTTNLDDITEKIKTVMKYYNEVMQHLSEDCKKDPTHAECKTGVQVSQMLQLLSQTSTHIINALVNRYSVLAGTEQQNMLNMVYDSLKTTFANMDIIIEEFMIRFKQMIEETPADTLAYGTNRNCKLELTGQSDVLTASRLDISLDVRTILRKINREHNSLLSDKQIDYITTSMMELIDAPETRTKYRNFCKTMKTREDILKYADMVLHDAKKLHYQYRNAQFVLNDLTGKVYKI